ncbi:probable GABA transporter 2 [Aegilops tauschii subsp. strangulata]|uniref:probable GABA transporter 2 n=1 Tax=Aegilops tauschii subsp. strangulata TaxID=200361 RepID=UPI003CC89204
MAARTGPAVSSPSAAVADEAATRRSDGEGKAAGDAGAEFVLESKGTWWHAGFHLTTAMVGPAVLSLPYALRGIGWALGLATLSALAAVSFYTYYAMSRVLDHCEAAGRRHIRFRDLAADVLGSGWAFYLMVAVQGAINVGVTIGSILLAGNSLQRTY